MNAHTSKAVDLKSEDQAKVQTFLQDVIHRAQVPGISVAMSVNGVTLEAAAGVSDARTGHPMTPEMHFELGCLNKFLTSLVVLELVSEGRIDLDQKISHYLSELQGPNGDIIKVRHLLSHTAGHQGENLFDPDIQQDYCYEEFTRAFNRRPMQFEPGTVFDYSHSGAVLLGLIVEAVTGRETRELVKERIFDPLGIQTLRGEHSSSARCVRGYRFDPGTRQLLIPFPIDWCEFWRDSLGGRWITMHDLRKIGQAIVSGTLFTEATRKLLLGCEVAIPGMIVGARAEQPYFSFGLGCAKFTNGTFGLRTSSVGQCSALRFDVERDIVVAVALNADTPYLRDLCVRKLIDAVLPENAPESPSFLPPVERISSSAEVTGTYRGNGGQTFRITHEAGKLEFSFANNASVDTTSHSFVLNLKDGVDGSLTLTESHDSLSVGFFKAVEADCLSVMIGCHAYRRESKNVGFS